MTLVLSNPYPRIWIRTAFLVYNLSRRCSITVASHIYQEHSLVVPIAFESTFDIFPTATSFASKNGYEKQELNYSQDSDRFAVRGDMAGSGSPAPFIKHEPDEYQYNPNGYPANPNGYNMNHSQSFDHQFEDGRATYGSVDPSHLSMAGTFNNNPFAPQQNLSSSFTMGNSGIADDELLDLGNLDEQQNQQNMYQLGQHSMHGQSEFPQGQGLGQGYFSEPMTGGMSMNQSSRFNQIYSNTPEGAPIQSPFMHGNFNYAQFRHQSLGQPQLNSNNAYGSIDLSSRGAIMREMGRKGSDSRSPLTPRTPAIGALQRTTTESHSLPAQHMHSAGFGHRHHHSLSTQWDDTPGSGHSLLDSPLTSPLNGVMHPQISEALKSGRHASLPTKVEAPIHGSPITAVQSQEAKRRRRRESHNMVERRRRDNINDRIQELSHLVPQHRLEDEKIRKHLINNSPMSPGISASMSPPQATSLLAGGNGRRAASITQGLPTEDKDKGPNKGDILNGAVSWTRDLMWLLYVKLQQESELVDYIQSLGGEYPFQQTEEEQRMRTELLDAIERNGSETFEYSRAPGSGLRVPKHTNVAGDAIQRRNSLSPNSMSPANLNNGSNGIAKGHEQAQPQAQAQYWHTYGISDAHDSLSFKEEDEFGMEI